jgi:hypothetical protein
LSFVRWRAKPRKGEKGNSRFLQLHAWYSSNSNRFYTLRTITDHPLCCHECNTDVCIPHSVVLQWYYKAIGASGIEAILGEPRTANQWLNLEIIPGKHKITLLLLLLLLVVVVLTKS